MFGAESLLQYGALGLFILAFVESVFFPIPPDVILLPLAMVNKRLSFWYAFLCTLASILGAIAGYILGRRIGRPLLVRFIKSEKIQDLENLFNKYGGWAVGIAAFTPIPYKVFTIAGGMFKVPMPSFLLASLIGRGGRFFLEGAFVFFLGDKAASLLGGRFEIITLAVTAALVISVWLFQKLFSKNRLVKPRKVLDGARNWSHSLFSWLSQRKEQNPWFLVYAFCSSFLLLVFASFAEDLFGPERLAINRTLGPAFLWLGTKTMFFGQILATFGSNAFTVKILSLGIFLCVLRRVRRREPASVNMRELLALGAWLFSLYVFNRILSMLLQLGIGEGAPWVSKKIVLLAPSFLFFGIILAIGRKTIQLIAPWLVFPFGLGVALLLLLPVFWVREGFFDPASGGAAVLGNLVAISLSLMGLSYKKVRDSS